MTFEELREEVCLEYILRFGPEQINKKGYLPGEKEFLITARERFKQLGWKVEYMGNFIDSYIQEHERTSL